MDSTILQAVEETAKNINIIVGSIAAIIGAVVAILYKINKLGVQLQRRYDNERT